MLLFVQYFLSSIDSELDTRRYTVERGHKEILNRVDYIEENVINACVSPGKLLLVDGGTLHGQSYGFDDTSLPGDILMKKTHILNDDQINRRIFDQNGSLAFTF